MSLRRSAYHRGMRWSVDSLNIGIKWSSTILASKDEMPVLDLDSLAGESLDKDLHASTKMQDYVDG